MATKLRSGPCSAKRLAVRPPPPPALPNRGARGWTFPRSVHSGETNKQADLLPAIAVGCQRSPGDRGHVDDGRRAPWLRHRLTVFAQALDVKPDCLADLADRLFPGRSGRHAAG